MGVTKRNLWAQSGRLSLEHSMPVIRFLREGRDVECYPGENLREVALREGIQLYGLKGQLGNCGGCGQCITCFVKIEGDSSEQALSRRTAVEGVKLKRRPEGWRLACQALVEQSVVVVTKPQTSMADQQRRVAAALQAPLPSGPVEWPRPVGTDDGEEGAVEDGDVEGSADAEMDSEKAAPPATPGDDR